MGNCQQLSQIETFWASHSTALPGYNPTNTPCSFLPLMPQNFFSGPVLCQEAALVLLMENAAGTRKTQIPQSLQPMNQCFWLSFLSEQPSLPAMSRTQKVQCYLHCSWKGVPGSRRVRGR